MAILWDCDFNLAPEGQKSMKSSVEGSSTGFLGLRDLNSQQGLGFMSSADHSFKVGVGTSSPTFMTR